MCLWFGSLFCSLCMQVGAISLQYGTPFSILIATPPPYFGLYDFLLDYCKVLLATPWAPVLHIPSPHFLLPYKQRKSNVFLPR
jgi:hypothetical protein